MTGDLIPQIRSVIQNDSGMTIPPYSVVVVTSVEYFAGDDFNDSEVIHHVDQYNGQPGNILVTGGSAIRPGSADMSSASTGSSSSVAEGPTDDWAVNLGVGFADMLIYVAVDPSIPGPNPGEQWGPVAGKWYITKGGNQFFAQGNAISIRESSSSGGGPMANSIGIFFRGNAASAGSGGGGGGGGGTGCGCCSCFSCITSAQATVGGCSAAGPNGAAYQYLYAVGLWAAYSTLTPSGQINLTYGAPAGCGSSSSSSSSGSGGGGSGCIWYGCPQTVIQPASSGSSTSGSSSGGGAVGTYQYQGTIYTDAFGKPAWEGKFVLLSGTDWLMIA